MSARARAAAVVAFALWAGAPPAGAQTLSCPRGLVSTGDSKSTVLQRCGSPARRFVDRRPVRAINPQGFAITTWLDQELWVYDRGSGRFIGLLVFDGDRLRRIERGPRR